ncbi:hypothetical protein MRX96_056023 [Rhipicephalus microplus]
MEKTTRTSAQSRKVRGKGILSTCRVGVAVGLPRICENASPPRSVTQQDHHCGTHRRTWYAPRAGHLRRTARGGAHSERFILDLRDERIVLSGRRKDAHQWTPLLPLSKMLRRCWLWTNGRTEEGGKGRC